MENQYFIANLSAKIDNISIKDDTIHHYVRKENNAVNEVPIEINVLEATHLENKNENEQMRFSTNKHLEEMDQFLNSLMLKICELK